MKMYVIDALSSIGSAVGDYAKTAFCYAELLG
jgi:hypothetical protein